MADDVQMAMTRAAKRRLPLAILVLPSDATEQAALKHSYDVDTLAPLVVWHFVSQGTAEFGQLSAVSGVHAATVPRMHLFPPQARGLPPAILQGESLNCGAVRNAVHRAAALVKTEVDAIKAELPNAAKAATKRPVVSAPSKAPAAAVPAAATPVVVVPPTPAPTQVAPPSSALRVEVLSTEAALPAKTVDIATLRSSHALSYARKIIASKLGHSNFNFQRCNGSHVATYEEERLIVGDIRAAPAASPKIVLSQAQSLAELAKLSHVQEGSQSRSPANLEQPPPSQKGPMPEEKQELCVTVFFPDGATEVLQGAPNATLTHFWARLSARMTSGSMRLLLTNPGKADEAVQFADATRFTLGDVSKFARVTVKSDVAPAKPESVPPASGDGSVKIRLVFPDGGNVTSAFCSDAALRAVHDAAADTAGDRNFYLQQPYPPKRYTEEDLSASLESLGIRGNVTLRVLRIAGGGPPSAQNGNGNADDDTPRTAPPAGALGGLGGLLSGVASSSARLVGGLFGRGAPPQHADPNAPPPAAEAQQPPPSAARQGPARSLAELRLREGQEEDRRRAASGGTNTYFGGDSTEYQSRPPPQ